jgi:hypothetical protein
MLRIALLNILMFSLPFILYGGYMYLIGRHQPGQSIWRTAPVLWLLIAGLVLIMVTVGSLISFTGSKPGGVYYPPKVENGKIIPGHIEH